MRQEVYAAGIALLLIAGEGFAEDRERNAERADRRGDRVEERFDRRGEAVDRRIERHARVRAAARG